MVYPLQSTMPKANPSASDAKVAANLPGTYEEAVRELEQLTSRLESGDVPLDQLLAGYQRGTELLQYCRGKLESVEGQIKVLDANQLKPWTPE